MSQFLSSDWGIVTVIFVGLLSYLVSFLSIDRKLFSRFTLVIGIICLPFLLFYGLYLRWNEGFVYFPEVEEDQHFRS